MVWGPAVKGERSESEGREAPLTAGPQATPSHSGEAETPARQERKPVPATGEREKMIMVVTEWLLNGVRPDSAGAGAPVLVLSSGVTRDPRSQLSGWLRSVARCGGTV